MLNALWFRSDGGAERYGEYGAAVVPILADVGAELLFPSLPVAQSLEGGFDPDLLVFVRYPSLEAFDAMWQSDAYRAVAHLRTEAIAHAVLTRCRIEPEDAPSVRALAPGIVVLNCLWFSPGGSARYDDYLRAAQPLVERHGGGFVSPRLSPVQALGDDFVPDLVFLGQYPSADAVFELVADPDYAAPAAIRTAAVARSATTLLRVDAAGAPRPGAAE